MWNVKCENARNVQNIISQCKQPLHFLQFKFASNLHIIWFNLKKPDVFFLLDLQQDFYEIFFGRKSLFHFFVVVDCYLFLQEWLHSDVTAHKLGHGVVPLKIPRMLVLFAMLVVVRTKFQWNWATTRRFKKFKENYYAKVSFLKLLPMEILAGCFH